MRLGSKQKRAIRFIGITAAVYLSFRYLLPLVIPFLLAYWISLAITPSVKWMKEHLRVPEGLGAVIMLILAGVILGGGLFLLGQELIRQLCRLAERLPEYLRIAEEWLTGCCRAAEEQFHLEDGMLIALANDMADSAGRKIQETVMPFVMENSVPLIVGIVEIVTVIAIMVMAAVLSVKEREGIRKLKEESMYSREIQMICGPVARVGRAYLRSQAIILLIITAVCIGGLFLIGNSYSVVLGILIGLLDALPLFGTGTALIPWALVMLITGKIYQAAVLLTLYLACYFIREILEAKLMGKRTGMTPLETMLVMYVGLRLFGLLGLFLGPIGWLLIKEIDKSLKVA